MPYETHTMKDKRIAGYMNKIGTQNGRIDDLEVECERLKNKLLFGIEGEAHEDN